MKKRFGNTLRKNKSHPIRILILFILVNIILKTFIIDIYKIRGNSMFPTLKNGDYVLVLKCAYGIRLPRNIYEVPWLGILLNYLTPKTFTNQIINKNKNFTYLFSYAKVKRNDLIAFNIPTQNKYVAVKRCIKLPSEAISIYSKSTIHSPTITPFKIVPYKGYTLSLKKLSKSEIKNLMENSYFFHNNDSTCTSISNCYFVLGDNINNSNDSRIWGTIPFELIVGKVIYVF
ncbi:signal peptidase I [Phocaeicola coprophilus]|uniref:signal peptidase I n=1 Tax=Phocaeicola coprophilus TaxID=387090 RepID=UPI00241D62A8|nr:signal peptidase I [Phocaeicola coprophilus]